MKTKVIHAFLWILVCMVLGITCYQCRDLTMLSKKSPTSKVGDELRPS